MKSVTTSGEGVESAGGLGPPPHKIVKTTCTKMHLCTILEVGFLIIRKKMYCCPNFLGSGTVEQ